MGFGWRKDFMSKNNLTLVWLRRDLRLMDHPALVAAAERGSVIPVYIHDDAVAGLGAAPKWRLGQALKVYAQSLEQRGVRLILRSGPAQQVLEALIADTGASAVYWSRLYDPEAIERDSRIKASLTAQGVEAQSFQGHLLFEPWNVATQQGDMYKVYSPYWRAVKDREVAKPLPEPVLSGPLVWPESEALETWGLGKAMRRGGPIVRAHCTAGEQAAQTRWEAFFTQRLSGYKARRDFVAQDATSGMSEYLSLGEISPRQIWHGLAGSGSPVGESAEHFRKELVWREFAYHLMYHSPRLLDANWRDGWDEFPWSEDQQSALAIAWKRGRTGIRLVDAGLREMYVTGRMHNRARMIVASYLTKHMLVHWRIGQAWFENCLTDWDPASNAMGWQWVAGCGPDAAPYFRVFNPDTQLKKFDPDEAYIRDWIAEGQSKPSATALSYFQAIPKSWGMSPNDPYPAPVVALDVGREAALSAYQAMRAARED